MSRRILVIGLGRFGAALAESLAARGCEVVAVDSRMVMVDAVKHVVTYALELDASDPNALRAIEPTSCQAAIVTIGESFEAAVLSVAALKELGVQNILARATSARHARILLAAGASRVIELEAEMGRALGRELASGDLAATSWVPSSMGVGHGQTDGPAIGQAAGPPVVPGPPVRPPGR